MDEDEKMMSVFDHVLEQITDEETEFFINAVFYYWIGDYELFDYYNAHMKKGHWKLTDQFIDAHSYYLLGRLSDAE